MPSKDSSLLPRPAFPVLCAILLVAAFFGHCPAQADILVSNFSDNAVVRLDENTGERLGTFTQDVAPIGPQGLAFGSNGNLFVVSWSTNRVLEYDRRTGSFVRMVIDCPPW